MANLDKISSKSYWLTVFGVEPSQVVARNARGLRESQKGLGITDVTALLPAPTQRIHANKIPSSKVRKNLDKALEALREVFEASVDQTIGDLALEEIEVGLEIGTDGQVGIPGIGITISGKSNITVKFKRNQRWKNR